MINQFNIKPALTLDQFFKAGFGAEMKVIFMI
jgi:hypothetical protein